MDEDAAIGAGSKRDPNRAVNRHRQDESLVVVGMLANQVHPSRRADDKYRRLLKNRLKICSNVFFYHTHILVELLDTKQKTR
jgi:hypothetical protein